MSSIYVFMYTVVAQSFQGRPSQHPSVILSVALASGDYMTHEYSDSKRANSVAVPE